LGKRNNKGRTASPVPFVAGSQQEAQFEYVRPTEFVELPSKGKLYPPDHPFHMREEIEVGFMTANEENILSSKVLLSKGLAFDRLLQSLIVGDVDVSTLVSGDKNALLVAVRATGYGPEYSVNVTCPKCGSKEDHEFDLNSLPLKYLPEDLETTPEGTFMVTLPMSGVAVELKYLNSKEQEYLDRNTKARIDNSLPETSITDFLKMVIVSVNSDTMRSKIESFVMNMPSRDSLHLRKTYNTVTPDINLKQDYKCSSCGTTTALEVPLGINFFWPN